MTTLEFDFPCSATYRLAEAEVNGEQIRREDYMTHKEREQEKERDEDWEAVERAFQANKLQENKPSPKLRASPSAPSRASKKPIY